MIAPLYSALIKQTWSSVLGSLRLEQVQLKATMMVKGLEHSIYQERLREMGMFSLEKRKLRRDLISMCKHLIGGSKEDTSQY